MYYYNTTFCERLAVCSQNLILFFVKFGLVTKNIIFRNKNSRVCTPNPPKTVKNVCENCGYYVTKACKRDKAKEICFVTKEYPFPKFIT